MLLVSLSGGEDGTEGRACKWRGDGVRGGWGGCVDSYLHTGPPPGY